MSTNGLDLDIAGTGQTYGSDGSGFAIETARRRPPEAGDYCVNDLSAEKLENQAMPVSERTWMPRIDTSFSFAPLPEALRQTEQYGSAPKSVRHHSRRTQQ